MLSSKQDLTWALKHFAWYRARGRNAQSLHNWLEVSHRSVHPCQRRLSWQKAGRVHQQLPWQTEAQDHVHERILRGLRVWLQEDQCVRQVRKDPDQGWWWLPLNRWVPWPVHTGWAWKARTQGPFEEIQRESCRSKDYWRQTRGSWDISCAKKVTCQEDQSLRELLVWRGAMGDTG